MINSVSNSEATPSKALLTTTDYKTSGLTRLEEYVWQLLSYASGSKGFKMKSFATGATLYNGDNTDLKLGANESEWLFNFQNDGTVHIQNKANNRFLGFTSLTSHAYKAYASSNLSSSSYPHAIKVYQLVTNVDPVSVGSTGYATFSSTHALNFTDVTDVRAYIATVDGTTGVNFTRVYKVPANTGLLLVSTSGGAVDATAVPYLTGDAGSVTGNVFVAASTDTYPPSEADGYSNYILNNGSSGIGFYKANGKKVGAGKAYISVPTSATVKGFITLPDYDDATGVHEIVNGQSVNGQCYNLAGHRVNGVRKGFFIVNGKKVIK